MNLCNDRILSIRIKFCQVAEVILIKLLTKDDIDEKLELFQTLNVLKGDLDNEVSEAAYDCINRANIQYKEKEDDYYRKV